MESAGKRTRAKAAKVEEKVEEVEEVDLEEEEEDDERYPGEDSGSEWELDADDTDWVLPQGEEEEEDWEWEEFLAQKLDEEEGEDSEWEEFLAKKVEEEEEIWKALFEPVASPPPPPPPQKKLKVDASVLAVSLTTAKLAAEIKIPEMFLRGKKEEKPSTSKAAAKAPPPAKASTSNRENWFKPKSRKGMPKHSKTYDDNLSRNQRYRLRKKEKAADELLSYTEYCELKAEGEVSNSREYKHKASERADNFHHMRGERYTEEEGKGFRGRFARLKKAHEMLVARGVHPDETPLGKIKLYHKLWREDPERTQCPICENRFQQCSGVHTHIKSIHRFCANLLGKLPIEEIRQIEEDTRLAANKGLWRFMRRGRFTGTRVSAVFRRKRADPYQLARKFCMASGDGYKSFWMKRGNEMEPEAFERYKEEYGIEEAQYPVGFCVHPEMGFIGSTPDAFVGTDGVVEIKCPMTPIDEIPTRKNDRFLVKSDTGPRGLRLKRNHRYFDQVVTEIMCTDRQYCDFVVCYRNDATNEWDLWRERIWRKEAQKHWDIMLPILKKFYFKYLGPPELAD